MKTLLAAFALLISTAIPVHAQTVDNGINARDAGDYEKAKAIFLPLAETGDAKAMNAIGRLHSNGWGYPQDSKLACDWFEKSATAGYASGQSNYGSCFKLGDGRPQNYLEAIIWKEKAALQGNLNAQNSLGHIHWKLGQKDEAAYWWKSASDAGSKMARVSMWMLDIEYEGPQATYKDIACDTVMIGLLGKPWNYCD